MSMAEELTTRIELGPVEEDRLAVMGLDREEEIVTSMRSAGIVTMGPKAGELEDREYIVEVEFKPDGYALDEESFDEYLNTYRDASVTQEAMTVKIQEDLKSALNLSNAFVEVHRMEPTDKRTHVGHP